VCVCVCENIIKHILHNNFQKTNLIKFLILVDLKKQTQQRIIFSKLIKNHLLNLVI